MFCSFGTFSFWSAYLRPTGDVVVADGYYQIRTSLLEYINTTLPWKLLRDPCYHYSEAGVPLLTEQCKLRKEAYGVSDS